MRKIKSGSIDKKTRSKKLIPLEFSQRAEDFVLNEIKKEIMQNPDIMKQFGPEKGFSSEGGEE